MNSLEEVMLDVYRLDYAEFDDLPKHHFSRSHGKAMKEILYPDYPMMMDYRIEQSRVPLKKRILIAMLVIVLAMMGTAMGAVALSRLIHRTESDFEVVDSVMQWNITWFEDGMFYEAENKIGEEVLCYYSKTNDRSAVMCGMPECTHISKTSPNCGALKGSDTHSRYGFNRIGDKLYFLAVKSSSEDSIGSIDLIKCDMDGKNQHAVASIKDTFSPFITDVRYFNDQVLVSYYQNSDLVKNENTGEFEFVTLEKYRFYMKLIDISTGKVETLVSREEYDGLGGGTVYQNTVYYIYSYHIEPPTGEMLTPETAPKLYGGFYVRDLSTGEEKEYENISVLGESFDYFSPDRIMCYDKANKKLCIFAPETGTFNNIADYNMNGYTADGKNSLFIQNSDSEFWTNYNFETGELTQIQCYTGDLDIHPNFAHTVGNTVWLDVSPTDNGNSLRHAYIDRDDFFAGKYENARLIKEAELK